MTISRNVLERDMDFAIDADALRYLDECVRKRRYDAGFYFGSAVKAGSMIAHLSGRRLIRALVYDERVGWVYGLTEPGKKMLSTYRQQEPPENGAAEFFNEMAALGVKPILREGDVLQ